MVLKKMTMKFKILMPMNKFSKNEYKTIVMNQVHKSNIVCGLSFK